MRYNSIEHLVRWESTGKYPIIHNKLYKIIERNLRGESVLDLCCSTGLLGQRISSLLGVKTVGIDADITAIENARSYGVDVDIQVLKINPINLDPIMEVISNYKITALVARRCMPELFSANILTAHNFSSHLASADVEEIFLQGRVRTKAATNLLPTLDAEIKLFLKEYDLVERIGDVAYMRKRL